MYPMYRWTDPFTPNENPRFEANNPSHHMKMNPMAPGLSYQPWPYGSNYGYPAPPEPHDCCSHSHSHSHGHNHISGPYSFQPPYPHYTPPFHFHGGYPPFPATYPPFSVPPPHYRFEQPIYEYDKNAPHHHHCCKCDEDRNPRILEEPKVELRRDDSWVPPELRNCPYPIVWIPREAKEKEKEKDLHDHGHDEKSKLFDIKTLEPSTQGENEKGPRNGDVNNLPFPFFLLPYINNEVVKDPKDSNFGQRSPSIAIDDKKTEENSASEDDVSKIIKKVIPVKRMETQDDKRRKEGREMKTVDPKDQIEEKSSGNIGKKQSSPPKTSKLPPVCLRIDPPPKKKNGNGGSRSPSPPKNKEKSKNLATESVKKSNEDELSKNNIKNVMVINGVTDKDNSEKTQLGNGGFEIGEREEMNHVKKVERKKLSEQEAAMVIQAAYRGFEVRKSQPLMKLKLIAEVRKQVADVRNRVQDLESSSSSCMQIDDKQKVIIGETIMSHLLKLDTIQGLHPVVRDVRKSVAKELVCLQERLDSLTFSKSEAPSYPSGAESLVVQETFDQPKVKATSNFEDVEPDSSMKDSKSIDPSKPSSLETGMCSKENSKDDDLVQETFDQPQVKDSSNFEDVEPDSSMKDSEFIDPSKPSSLETDMCSKENSKDDDLVQEMFDQPKVKASSNFEDVEPDSSMKDSKFIDPPKPSSPETGICSKDEVESTEHQDDDVVQAHNLTLEPHVELKSQSQSQQSNEESNDGQLRVSMETEGCVELPSLDVPEEKISMAAKQLDDLHGQGVQTDSSKSQSQHSNEESNDCQLGVSMETEECVELPSLDVPEEKISMAAKELDDLHGQGVQTDLGVAAQIEPENAIEAEVVVAEPLMAEEDVHVEQLPNEDGGQRFEACEMEAAMAEWKKVSRDEAVEQKELAMEEENKRLKEAMEKLIKSGNEQLAAISKLTERVKDLEKKLSRKKKLKMRKCKAHGVY